SVTSEIIYMRASDGTDFSSWQKVTITESHNNASQNNHAPNVSVHDLTASTHGVSFAASSMFSSSDADGDTIKRVQFLHDHQAVGTADDNPANDTSGHFVLNGVALPEGQYIDVAISDLSHLSFVSGSGTDLLWARVFDGQTWSAGASFH